MASQLQTSIERLKPFLDEQFAGRRYFALVYGSYAYNTEQRSSDLDILIATENPTKADRSACISEVINMHDEMGMGIDNEISHEKKLIVPYKFLGRAVSGEGVRNAAGDPVIPEIKKTPEYLSSDPLLLRFFLGAMNHAHIPITDSFGDYRKFRLAAEASLLRTVVAANRLSSATEPVLVDSYIHYKGRTGDYLFGFEDKPYYRNYLSGLVHSASTTLQSLGQARLTRGQYFFDLDRTTKPSDLTLAV